MKTKQPEKIRPKQEQRRPGTEKRMKPEPESTPLDNYKKLDGKVALITGSLS